MKIVEWLSTHKAIVECDKCSSHIELSIQTIDKQLNFCSDECRSSFVQKDVCVTSARTKKKNKRLTIYERYRVGSSPIDKKLVFLLRARAIKRLEKYGIRTIYAMLCFDACQDAFGLRNVTTNVSIDDWKIDIYIKSLDAYVQVFSVYWHGLDRTIEQIKEFKNPRDKMIYDTYLRDKQQSEWFRSNHKTLVRFTDKEILQWLNEKKLVEEIRSRIQLAMTLVLT